MALEKTRQQRDFDEHMLNRIGAKLSNNQNGKWYQSDVIHDEWGA